MSPSPAPGNLPSSPPGGHENGAAAPISSAPVISGGAGASRGGRWGGPSQSLHPCRNLCVSDAVSSVLVLPLKSPVSPAGSLCFTFFLPSCRKWGAALLLPCEKSPSPLALGLVPAHGGVWWEGSAPLSPGSTSLGLALSLFGTQRAAGWGALAADPPRTRGAAGK